MNNGGKMKKILFLLVVVNVYGSQETIVQLEMTQQDIKDSKNIPRGSTGHAFQYYQNIGTHQAVFSNFIKEAKENPALTLKEKLKITQALAKARQGRK